MTSLLPLMAGRYSETYKMLREEILQLAQLDAITLDHATIELEVDLEVYPFEHSEDPQVQAQVFATDYAAFDAMMLDGFARFPWPKDIDSILEGLHEYHLYLIWAWRENNLAYWFLCNQPVDFEANDAQAHGLTAAQSAQRAYKRGVAMLSRKNH